MFGYLLGIILITLILGGGAYYLIQTLVQAHRLQSYDGKGYYMVLMFFVTFIAGAAAYFWGQPEAAADSSDLGRAATGLLVTVGMSVLILAVGLLNIREKSEIL